MIQYKHAKLLRQCVLFLAAKPTFYGRNDCSRRHVDPSIGGGGGGAIWGYIVYVRRHVGLHRQSNCIYILPMPCVGIISAWNQFDFATDHRLG